MALRLRRGTDAERSLITPLEGELIYTTDTKKLFVGDGITVGGIAVDTTGGGGGLADLSNSSINDLADVNADSTLPSDGDVLTYDGATGDWRSATPVDNLDALTDVTLGTLNDGDVLQYDSIAGQWNAAARSISGNIEDLDNVVIAPDSTEPTEGQVLTFDSESQVWYNDNVPVTNLEDDLSPSLGGNLDLNGNSIFGTGDILATNIIAGVEIRSPDFVGNVTGNVTGDLIGSVFADNSSILVDGLAGVLRGTFAGDVDITSTMRNTLVNADATGAHFYLYKGTEVNPLEPDNFDRIAIKFASYDPGTSQYVDEAFIASYHQSGGGGYIALSPTDAGGTFFNTSLELDGVAQTTSIVGKNLVLTTSNVPASSVGAAGDTAGMIAVDDNYLYRCTANFDGVADIWTRIAWTGGTW